MSSYAVVTLKFIIAWYNHFIGSETLLQSRINDPRALEVLDSVSTGNWMVP